jgi:two-component system cell cycle response regulator CpdR
VPEPDAPPPQPSATASDIEHDLVNSMASIVGFSQVIRRDPALPDDLRGSADLLVQEASRARGMVAKLLELVRQQPADPRATTRQRSVVPRLEPERTAAQASVTRPRVLVLDDDSSMRAFLDKALTLLGYEPVMTSMAADAVTSATVGDHAVLLFDHQMAGMSGAEAFEAIVAARPDLASRVVMMSGDTLRPGLEAFAARHPVAVLAKPFDLDTLDRTIRAVMEATGQSRG